MFNYIHFRQFECNEHGRDFVLGDLHGCYNALEKAMTDVSFNKDVDRLFSVGDLIDRGEHNLKCLSLLREPWFFAVQGNHENMLVAALRAGKNTPPWEGWIDNGGDWYLTLSAEEREEVQAFLPLITDLPVVARVASADGKQVGLCHAEPPFDDWTALINGKRLTGDEIWRAMWGRSILRQKKIKTIQGVDITFHGHTIVPRVNRLGNMHFIDTGAYLFNTLNLIEINDQLFNTDR